MFKGMVAAAALIVPLVAGASGLKTSDALTVKRDSATGDAVATCQTSVSGVDRTAPYSGVVRFLFDNPNDSIPHEEYYVTFHIAPATPTFTETSPGVYSLAASLKRRTVSVTFTFPRNLQNMEQLYCFVRIDNTPEFNPNTPGVTLYQSLMEYTQSWY